MKNINVVQIAFLSLSIIFFLSCDNDLPVNDIEKANQIEGMEVNDGCLIFQNMESFISICDFLSSMPYNEQKIWISKLDYVSLKARYDKEDALIKDADDSLDSDRISSS